MWEHRIDNTARTIAATARAPGPSLALAELLEERRAHGSLRWWCRPTPRVEQAINLAAPNCSGPIHVVVR